GTIVCGACAGTWACPARHSACAPTALAALARRARREIDTSAIVSLPVRGMSPKLSRASYFMAMRCLLLGFLVSAVASGGGGTPMAKSTLNDSSYLDVWSVTRRRSDCSRIEAG